MPRSRRAGSPWLAALVSSVWARPPRRFSRVATKWERIHCSSSYAARGSGSPPSWRLGVRKRRPWAALRHIWWTRTLMRTKEAIHVRSRHDGVRLRMNSIALCVILDIGFGVGMRL
ncbi:hypothetical protein DL769_007181 [Monosporascus sp. CRB-8-3]|nr:hypothetical protein DL769_007181 [Monosporascus sp. CRB-8-3]